MAAFKWNNIKRASASDRLRSLRGLEMRDPLRFLMEKLLAKQSSILPWYESLTLCDSLSNEQQLDRASLTSLMDKHILILQKAITYQSACLALDRLESIAKHFSLKFTVSSSGNEVFIHSEMFFWRFLLDSSGTIAEAEVSNNGVVENCPDLCEKLRCGQFEELHEHISGLLMIYSLGTDKKQKKKAFKALQLMESELNILSNMQNSVTNVSSYIHKSPLGILVPCCGGLPLRMIYFVSPYDLLNYKTKSSIPMTIEAIIDNKVGLSASVLIQNSKCHDALNSSDAVVSSGGRPFIPPSADFCFALRLHHPMAMSLSVIRKIEKVTGLNVIDDSALRPMTALLLEEKTRHKVKDRNCSWEWHAVVMFSGQHHHQYFVTGRQDSTDLFGALLSEIPFTHPTMCPAVIVLLRQQALFNTILSSCIRRRCHCRQDLNNVMTFEVTPVSLQHLTVTWEHRSLDMLATVELELTDLMAVECKMCPEFILENGEPCSTLATRVLQRSLSLPVTLRIILANTSSARQAVKIASCFTWENVKTEEEKSEDDSICKSDVTTEQSNRTQHIIPDGDPTSRKQHGSEQDSVGRCSIMEKLLSSENDLGTPDVSVSLSFLGAGHAEATRKPLVVLDDPAELDKVTLNPVLASLLEQELPKNIPVSPATSRSVLSGLLSDRTIQPPSFTQVKPRRTKKRSGAPDQSPVRKCVKWKLSEDSSGSSLCLSALSSQSSPPTLTVPIPKSPLRTAAVLTSPVKTVDSFPLNVPSLSGLGFKSNPIVSLSDVSVVMVSSSSSSSAASCSSASTPSSSGLVVSLSAISPSVCTAAPVLGFHADPAVSAVTAVDLQPSVIQQPILSSVTSPGLECKPDAMPVNDCSLSGIAPQKPDDSERPTQVLAIQTSSSAIHTDPEHLLPSAEASKTCKAGPIKDVILSALLSERESDDSILVGLDEEADESSAVSESGLTVFNKINSAVVGESKGCLSKQNNELSTERKSCKANQSTGVEEKPFNQVKTESAGGVFARSCSVVLSIPGEMRVEEAMTSNASLSLNSIKEKWKEKASKMATCKSQLLVKLTKGKILKEILEQEHEFESSLSVKESLVESQLNCKQNTSVDQTDTELNILPVSAPMIVTSATPCTLTESLTSNTSEAKGKRRSDKRTKNLKDLTSRQFQPTMKRPKKDDAKKSEMSKKQKIYDFDDENEIVNGDESIKAECQAFPTMIKITKSGGTLRIQEAPKVNSASTEVNKNIISESVVALSNVGTSKIKKLPEKGNSNVKVSINQSHVNNRVLNRSKSDSHSSFGSRGKSDSKLYKTALIKLKPVCVPASLCLSTGTSRPRSAQSVVVASCKPTLPSSNVLSKSKSQPKSGKGSLSAVIDKLTRQHSMPAGGIGTAVDAAFDRASQQKDLYDAIRLEIIREGNKPSTPTKEINSPHKSNVVIKRCDVPKPVEGKMLTENGNRYSFNNQNISGPLSKNPSPAVSSSLVSTSPTISLLRPASVGSLTTTTVSTCSSLGSVKSGPSQVTAGDTGLRLGNCQPVKDSKTVFDVLNPVLPKIEINLSSSRILAECDSVSSVGSPIDYTVTVIAADHDDNSKAPCDEVLVPSSANTPLLGTSTSVFVTSSLPGESTVPSYSSVAAAPKCSESSVSSGQKLKPDDSQLDRSGSRHFMDPLVQLNSQTKGDVSSSDEAVLPLTVHSNHSEDGSHQRIIPNSQLPLIGPRSCDAILVAGGSNPDTEEPSVKMCDSKETTGACSISVTYSPVPSPLPATSDVATTSTASIFPVGLPVKSSSSAICISQDIETSVLQNRLGSSASDAVGLPTTPLALGLPASSSLTAAESSSSHETTYDPTSSSLLTHQNDSAVILSCNSCSPMSLPSPERDVNTEPVTAILLNNSMTERPTSCSSSSQASSPVNPDSPADFLMPVLSRLCTSSPKNSHSVESVTFQPVADSKPDSPVSEELSSYLPVPDITAKSDCIAAETCLELKMSAGTVERNLLGTAKLKPETTKVMSSGASQSNRTSPGSLAALSDIDDDLMNEALIL